MPSSRDAAIRYEDATPHFEPMPEVDGTVALMISPDLLVR